MANVVRFLLSTSRDLHLSGHGLFFDNGVLDVDANDLDLVTRVRYLVQPYGAAEYGVVAEGTPAPILPAPPLDPPEPDPYPQYATLDDLSAFAVDYELKATSIVIPATAMFSSLGTPSLVSLNGVHTWQLDQTADEGVTCLVTLPSHWLTFNVAVTYTNIVATAGDVRFRWNEQFITDGSTLSGVASIVGVVNTAPAQNVVKTFTLATGRTVGTGLLAVKVDRTGSNAADTLAGDAGLIAVTISQAS